MKKLLGIVGGVVNRLVWAVGCFAIVRYAWQHWPVYTALAGGLMAGLGVWYCRRFYLERFGAGVSGER
jgi:hypothetical protein